MRSSLSCREGSLGVCQGHQSTEGTHHSCPRQSCPHSRYHSHSASGQGHSGCSCSGTGRAHMSSHLVTHTHTHRGYASAHPFKLYPSPVVVILQDFVPPSSPHSSLGSSEASPQSSSPSHFHRAGMHRPESLQRNSSTPHVIWAVEEEEGGGGGRGEEEEGEKGGKNQGKTEREFRYAN